MNPKEDYLTTINATLITEEKARFKESSKSYVTKGGNKMVLLSPSTIVMGAKEVKKAKEPMKQLER